MYARADRVKARGVDRAGPRLETQGGLTDAQRETVADMADALVGQLLAAPTQSLRDAAGEGDWETVRTVRRLFDSEFTPETGEGEAGALSDAGAGPSDMGSDTVAEELDD